jgi:hypothetical protein
MEKQNADGRSNCSQDIKIFRTISMEKQNVVGSSRSSHVIKKFRTRTMMKQKGMHFFFMNKPAAVTRQES